MATRKTTTATATRKAVNKAAAARRVQRKFSKTLAEMCDGMIERDEEIKLVLVAMLCGENCTLVGPPGLGKSMLLDSIVGWLDESEDARTVSLLMHQQTKLEEVMGPVSVKGLKEDKFIHVTTNRLPEATFAFLDEIFKASPGLLNSMLRILNEGVFDNGTGGFQKCPLRLCVTASNEWPQSETNGQDLAALFDRFLFRKTVRPVSKAGRQRLTRENDLGPKLSTSLTLKELDIAQEACREMEFEESTWQIFDRIVDELNEDGIFPGDRRLRKAVQAAKAYAWLMGAKTVETEHLEILQHCLWNDPTDQPQRCARIVIKLANPTAGKVSKLLAQAMDVINKSTPGEAVPKLQAIQDELATLKGDKGESARKHIEKEIKRLYRSVIGV